MKYRHLSIVVVCVVGLLSACSHSPRYRTFQGNPAHGRVHVVRPGDTLVDLARAYQVPASRIARANQLRDPDRIYVGQRLSIPGDTSVNTGGGLGWQSKTPGIYHPLARGETLMALERTYGVRAGILKRINHIADETTLAVGRLIFVPGASRILRPDPPARSSSVRVARAGSDRSSSSSSRNRTSTRSRTSTPTETRSSAPPPAADPPAPAGRSEARTTTRQPAPATSRSGFVHPLAGQGALTSGFGPRSGSFHYGTDLAAPEGTPIYAIGPGTVEYVGTTREQLGKTLGNFVMLFHQGSGLRSLYAHCETVMVREGQAVRRGQVIARVGHTGRVRGPTGNHLHLEIRNEDGTALDPRNYVPGLD